MPQVVAYRRIKTRRLKKRSQSLARGSNCSDLGREGLVFWICGHFWEVVAHGHSIVAIIIMESRVFSFYTHRSPQY